MSSSSSAISGMLHPVMWPGEPRTSLPHRRTKQACDNCKARKAKCSNTKPCTNCQEADILCTSVKATARKSTRDWEIERLRSERTRLVNAVKVLHQQLSSRAPELYAPPPAAADGDDPTAPPTTTTTKTPPPAPPAEKLSVNEIVELIELSQERKKHGGSDDDPVHVTPATPPSPSSSCVSLSSSEGSVARRQRRRLSLNAGGPLTPSNTPALTPDTATAAATTTMTTAVEAQQQQGTDVMAEFGLELDCVDDFQWQPPDGAEDLPSCWAAGLVGEEWPGLGVGGGGLPGGLVGLDGMDQLSMDWTAGEGGAVWQ
ncbi:hypothetical protein BDY21DRAFT_397086 [Neofusicoccum parvum]|nr:hypothetical protein BDY21DRAFT_397086 [Neofusicoccum parvum]